MLAGRVQARAAGESPLPLVNLSQGSPRTVAQRFLGDLLADGPHRATEVCELADQAGISDPSAIG